MKKCPFCAESIQDDAIKCRYCGSMLIGGSYPNTLGVTDARNPALEAEIYPLLRAGRKIDAIKVLRERTGMGLKEAKDKADALQQQLALAQPGTAAPGAARALVFWLVLIVVGVLIWWGSSYFPHQ